MATVYVSENFPCDECKEQNALNYWKKIDPQDQTEEKYNYYTVCKFCIAKTIKDPFNIESVKEACRKIDIPFVESIWLKVATVNKAKKDNGTLPKYSNMQKMTEQEKYHISVFSEYLKQAKLKANKHLFVGKGFDCSKEFTKSQIATAVDMMKVNNPTIKRDIEAIESLPKERQNEALMPIINAAMNEVEDILDEFGQINIARLSEMDKRYMIKKWGDKYEWDELLWLEQMWIKMCNSYDITTASHEDYLLKICKISRAIEKYTAEENWDLALQLGKMYDTWMKSAQFAESSRKKDKIDESIPAICQVIEMAEKLGYIEPTDLTVPRDIVDLTLRNMNSYTKRLVLNETNLGALLEGAIEKMRQSEATDESELDDLPDAYDLIEQGIGEPGEIELITSANFEDYQEHFEDMMGKEVGTHDFEPPQGFDIDNDYEGDDEEDEV